MRQEFQNPSGLACGIMFTKADFSGVVPFAFVNYLLLESQFIPSMSHGVPFIPARGNPKHLLQPGSETSISQIERWHPPNMEVLRTLQEPNMGRPLNVSYATLNVQRVRRRVQGPGMILLETHTVETLLHHCSWEPTSKGDEQKQNKNKKGDESSAQKMQG